MSVTLVAGGAGFLGSHMCRRLLGLGDVVICVDNLSTGRHINVADMADHERFHHVKHDITVALEQNATLTALLEAHPVSRICNFASPASPFAYAAMPVETLMVGSIGMRHLLDLALRTGARILQSSTSEVYGDPDVHPQPETYWGRVNPIGPRSMYDESKRFAEALCAAYERTHGVDLRMARIFNTYGPAMSPEDGRVVTNFIGQALRNDDITIFGDGSQTRSFCYVDDEISGFMALLESNVRGPVNIGNPVEFTMIELAHLVLELTGSQSSLVHRALPGDDPTQRCPDIGRAQQELGWTPQVALAQGLERTIAWFKTLPQFAGL